MRSYRKYKKNRSKNKYKGGGNLSENNNAKASFISSHNI